MVAEVERNAAADIRIDDAAKHTADGVAVKHANHVSRIESCGLEKFKRFERTDNARRLDGRGLGHAGHGTFPVSCARRSTC